MSGLFSSEGASCGPVNPLQSLNKHNDRSFDANTRISLATPPSAEQQQFNSSNRLNRIDNHLESEFAQFTNNPHSLPQFQQPSFQHPGFQERQPSLHERFQASPVQDQFQHSVQQQQQQQQQHRPDLQHQWSLDFAKLSIQNTQQHQQQQQPQQGWNSEFRQQVPQNAWNTQSRLQVPQTFQPSGIRSTNLLSSFATSQPTNLTEHQELHKDEQFDALFEQIESQILKPTEQEIVRKEVDYDREKFAQTAQLVANAMSSKSNMKSSSAMSKKFANSNFLKLMTQVSDKKVVINEGKDGFITNDEH